MGGMIPPGIKMKNLPGGMYPRIRPARPNGTDGASKNLGETLFNFILHRLPVGLLLPAVKRSAVIGTEAPPSSQIRAWFQVFKLFKKSRRIRQAAVASTRPDLSAPLALGFPPTVSLAAALVRRSSTR